MKTLVIYYKFLTKIIWLLVEKKYSDFIRIKQAFYKVKIKLQNHNINFECSYNIII